MLPPRAELRADGEAILRLRHPEPLQAADDNLVALLERCCARYAARRFLSERDGEGWRSLSFAAFATAVEQAAAVLAAEGIAAGSRVGILAPNGIAHAVASFAVLALGAVAVPLSPAYLAHPRGAALLGQLARSAGVEVLLHDEALPVWDDAPRRVGLGALMRRLGGGDAVPTLRERAATIASRQPAKIFFTSGSTGTPKAVVNTHGALAAAAAMLDQVGPRLPDDESPVVLDWLPWTHAFGGNANLHWALLRGASFHIDAGAPVAGRFEQTLRNLADVCPTSFTTVPTGYPLLLDALERDAALAARFFSRLRVCSFGGAALSAAVIERFQALSLRVRGTRMPFGGGYGMTETCGVIALVWWDTERGDLLGLPLPGIELKLVRGDGGRWECRVRGANVFDGYLGGDDGAAFDDEGFFVTGDAVELADRERPEQGLIYAGRLREDFKLANGSWVRVGPLRAALLDHLRPLAADLVVLGENRDEPAALVWLAEPGVAHEAAQAQLLAACRDFNRARRGATERIGRVLVAARPPDAAAGELTAKGTLNARRIAEQRGDELARLYTDPAFRV
ncbi:AMP-binding protein [Solimonas flava]|uniref:AMP-binding protein n=1 Tax=Solimonas flava TaxID=415849 RepID=UPI0004101DEC|nr:AMP-binding protein [Solimonas flava]